MISLDQPLDQNASNAAKFLKDIQGNILKGHGRDFTAHLLLKMSGKNQALRGWIAQFASDHVTTAASALDMTSSWRKSGDEGDPFAMFLLAPDGYRYLGFEEDQLPLAGGDPRFKNPAHDEYFLRGMKNQASVPQDFPPPAGRAYNDPPPSEWEDPFQGEIHAMVLLADDNEKRLTQRIEAAQQTMQDLFEILTVERGKKLTSEFDRGKLVIEHFGFQDGISQPLLIKRDIEDDARKRGNKRWNPSAGLSLALAEEPTGGGYGSFMVFRKLEQNVKAFWEALEQLSKDSGIDLETAGAMATGRHRDGTLLLPTTTPDPKADPNDIHFDADPNGELCPFHAHIRKTNPRGDVPRIIGAPEDFERARRIVRRGITYGDRPDLDGRTVAEKPSAGVGLLFMCFQSNLDQFVIQQEGSDSNDFVQRGVGVDAIIGQNAEPVPQTWPSTGDVKFTMANFVKMLGGEYFFAPSMGFLKSL